jgi:hypothetical protein
MHRSASEPEKMGHPLPGVIIKRTEEIKQNGPHQLKAELARQAALKEIMEREEQERSKYLRFEQQEAQEKEFFATVMKENKGKDYTFDRDGKVCYICSTSFQPNFILHPY